MRATSSRSVLGRYFDTIKIGVILCCLGGAGFQGCSKSEAQGAMPPQQPTDRQVFGPVKLSDSALRDGARKTVDPIYPASARSQRHGGVAIAQITIDPSGRVTKVDVQEASDEAIAESMRKALQQWEFAPITLRGSDKGEWASGPVIYYFNSKNGIVTSPRDTFDRASPGDPSMGPDTIELVDEAQIGKLVGARDAAIVDFRERDRFTQGHRKGAINIPAPEISSRVENELVKSRPLIVDCSEVPMLVCRSVASQLKRRGFKEVFIASSAR